MSKLAAALEWARRGFPVFPLIENTKLPLWADSWVTTATTNEAAIRSMWTDPVMGYERDYNIGCLCNDYVVVDIDTKKGKDGYNQYLQMGGTFDTLVVRTTSGGYHCYFYGPPSSNAALAAGAGGVDVRSHNGYVVAPGSVVDGVPYTIVNDTELAWIPKSIEQRLTPPYTRKEVDAPTEGLDKPGAVAAAINFLQSCPVAVEGQRGDETTFTTAARLVRELAISEGMAYQLMAEHWNPRCQPPWSLDELLIKVNNAVRYGSADFASLSPETLFAGVKIVAPPTVFEASGLDFGNAITPQALTPRPWLVDRTLMHGTVTVLLAAGSAGKSTVSLALAAHVALGREFAGRKVHKACKVIVYNGEDDLMEQSRRLFAVCYSYGLDFNEVKKNVLLLSPREMRLTVVTKDGYKPQRNDILLDQLTNKAKSNGVGLIVIDPLVKIHQCDENDNVEMDYVMDALTDVAQKADTAIMLLHHTTKGGDRQEARVGNMDIARGASSVVNAARIAFTLLNASQQDAEDYGLQDEERHTWVRLDDAKMNLQLASVNATWFRKEGVTIPSGDAVGVLKHTALEKSRSHLRMRIATVLMNHMVATGAGSTPMATAVSVVKTSEPLMANKTDTELRKKIEGLFSMPVVVQGHGLQVKRDDADKLVVCMT